MRYYHGSENKLGVGTILEPQKGYGSRWGDSLFFMVLEMYRPSGMLSHAKAIFMVDNLNDIDNAGGSTDWIYEVQPLGKVEAHDLNWGSEIDSYISSYSGRISFSMLDHELKQPEHQKLRETLENLARNYWYGEEHYDEAVWEYLTPKARIINTLGGDAEEINEIRRRAGLNA